MRKETKNFVATLDAIEAVELRDMLNQQIPFARRTKKSERVADWISKCGGESGLLLMGLGFCIGMAALLVAVISGQL